jgi:autotransporter translocation and assembly factor TamB
MVILALILVLLWVGVGYVRRAGESYARGWIEERARLTLGARLAVGELQVALLPLGARASDVVVTSLTDGSVLARVDAVELAARWSDLRQGLKRLRGLTLEAPQVTFVRFEDGTTNWPPIDAGDGSGAGFAIDRLTVLGGAVELADRVLPLDLDLRQTRLQASGATDAQFAGRVDVGEAHVGLPNGVTYVGAVGARAIWEQGRLRIVDGRVSGPDLNAVVHGGELDLATRDWSLDFDAGGQAALLHRLGVGDQELAGSWEFAGTLTGGDAWRLAGRLKGRGVGWGDLVLARLEGDLTADDERFSLAGVEGRYAEGAVRADVTVAWADPERPVRIDAALTGGSIPALLQQFELELPEVAGSWSGRGHYVFRAEDPTAGNGALDLAMTARDRGGRLTWSRQVPVDIHHGVATFQTLTSDNERERISARGTYDLTAQVAQVDYRIHTDLVGAWIDLVGLGGDPDTAPWLPAAGGGAIEGSFHASPGDWWTRLTLDLQGVAIGQFSPAEVKGPLTASARGVRDLSLELSGPNAAMLVAGAIETGPTGTATFGLGVEVSGWAAEEFLLQLGLPASVSGPLEGSARIEGGTEDLRVTSRLAVSPAELSGLPVDRIEVALDVAGNLVTFSSAVAQMPAGRIEIAGSVPLAEGELDLTLALTLSDLAASPIGERLPAGSGGQLTGSGTLQGTLEQPVLEARLESRDLHLAGQDLSSAGPSQLNLRLAQGRLDLDGSLGELVTFEGGGALAETVADIEVAVASDRLLTLLAVAMPDVELGLDGRLRGVVRVAGDLSAALPPTEIRLDELTLLYAGHELTAIEPVRATWADEALQVQSFFLGDAATNSEIFLFGQIATTDAGSLDLQGQISLGMEWLLPFLPGWQAAGGSFEALASIGGTFSHPEISGQGEMRIPRLQSESLPQALREVEAVVLFYPDQVVVDDGKAGFAGGTLRAAGTLDPYAEGGLQYRFQAAAEDIQLRYPEGWQVRGNAELTVATEPGGQLVRGQVAVESALYTTDVPIGLTQLLQSAFSRRIELVEESDEFLTSTRLNLTVRGSDALIVRNNVANLRGDFDFAIRGTLARPVIFGTVDVAQGGTLLYGGNSYEVQRASLTFANPYTIEPVIDLVATTRLAEYDATLDLSGTLERLDVNFSSNPPLANLDVLALLAGGEVQDGTTLDSPTADSSGIAESFLYRQAASAVASRVNQLFGLDKFRIDPLTSGSGNLSSARVTVGKRLGRDLFATYSYDPSQSSQQILELEWRVSRQLTVVATQNGDESYAVDLRWDKSF